MLSTLKKFFDFCTEEDRKKFYTSVCLGVLKAFIVAFRIQLLGWLLWLSLTMMFLCRLRALSWSDALVVILLIF